MRTETLYFLEPRELGSELCYQLISECIGGIWWNTRRVKMYYQLNFNEQEQKVVDSIYRKCRKWHLKDFPTEEVCIPHTEMVIWQRLIVFILKCLRSKDVED